MSSPIKISGREMKADPSLVWNEYIAFLASSEYDELGTIQRVAFLVYWYESEVQNGGHLQYFENRGFGHVAETIIALQTVHANCHADVLHRAALRRGAKDRKELKSSTQYVAEALRGEYDDLDREFSNCHPQLTAALENYLHQNLADFVLVTE
jgi:hypothetical protein